jgi:hypothetical protein
VGHHKYKGNNFSFGSESFDGGESGDGRHGSKLTDSAVTYNNTASKALNFYNELLLTISPVDVFQSFKTVLEARAGSTVLRSFNQNMLLLITDTGTNMSPESRRINYYI